MSIWTLVMIINKGPHNLKVKHQTLTSVPSKVPNQQHNSNPYGLISFYFETKINLYYFIHQNRCSKRWNQIEDTMMNIQF